MAVVFSGMINSAESKYTAPFLAQSIYSCLVSRYRMLRKGIHELPFITICRIGRPISDSESFCGSTRYGSTTVKNDHTTSSSTVKDYVVNLMPGLDDESFCELVRKPATKLAIGWLTLDSYCIFVALQLAYPADNVAFSAIICSAVKPTTLINAVIRKLRQR